MYTFDLKLIIINKLPPPPPPHFRYFFFWSPVHTKKKHGTLSHIHFQSAGPWWKQNSTFEWVLILCTINGWIMVAVGSHWLALAYGIESSLGIRFRDVYRIRFLQELSTHLWILLTKLGTQNSRIFVEHSFICLSRRASRHLSTSQMSWTVSHKQPQTI
jgi:hypothetical protein